MLNVIVLGLNLYALSIMDAVDAFLREIQGGATLEPRSLNNRQRPSSPARQLFNYSQSRPSRQAWNMADAGTPARSQQPIYGRQDRFDYQSQMNDPSELPLDAFGQLWFRAKPQPY